MSAAIFLAVVIVLYLTGERYISQEASSIHANKLMASSDVSGLVQTINLHEGRQAKVGEVLFTVWRC
jgi:membrane fusion protein (multidrug efflux system)